MDTADQTCANLVLSPELVLNQGPDLVLSKKSGPSQQC